MAIKIEGTEFYKCPYCNFKARSVIDVDDHRDQEHSDVLLVPLKKSDLVRLMQFFFTGEKELISEELYLTLRKYATYTPKNDQKFDKMI